MVNASTYNTFYDDVRVGDDAIVVRLATGAGTSSSTSSTTSACRSARPGMVERVFDEVVAWTQDTKLPDGRPGGRPGVGAAQPGPGPRQARVRQAHQLEGGRPRAGANPADASATKVFATEFYTEAYRLLMEVLGPAAYLDRGSPGAVLAGRLERAFQGCPHPHLRRRRERGAARPHRPVRRRPAPGAAALTGPWTSPSPTSSRRSPTSPHRILGEQLAPERLRELEQAGRVVRRRRVGRARPGRPARHRPARGDGGGGLRAPRGVPRRRAGRSRRRAGAVPHAIVGSAPARSPSSAATRSGRPLLPGVIDGERPAHRRPLRARRRRRPGGPGHPGRRRRRRLAARRREGARRRRRPRRGRPRARRTGERDHRRCSSCDPDAAGVHASSARWPSPASRSGPCGSTAWRVGDDAVLGAASSGAEIVAWIIERACRPPCCATQTGVCEEALAITARYVSEREQFGAQARHLPGRRPPRRRRLHRHRGHPPHRLQAIWRLDGGPRRPRRADDGQVLGRRGRPAGRPRRPAPPRRHRHGPRLPDPPLLPVGEGARAHARRAPARRCCGSAPASPRSPRGA